MGLRKNDFLGRIEVSPRVIATIAEEAALQCYGIVGLASRYCGGIWTKSPPANRRAGGVAVRVEDDHVTLELYVIIEYGTRISEVARNVMSAVKFAVEQALGIPVEQVHVYVQGIHLANQS
mgnify:CR=1 FL=1